MGEEKNIRKPKQKRSMEKKQLIIDTAKDLFCQKGYYATTTNEIAKTAGLSIGTLYSYFADKQTILLELLNQYNDYFYEAFEFIDTAENARLFAENPRLWFRILVEKLIQIHEPQAQFNRELQVLYYSMPAVTQLIDAQSERVRLATLKIIQSYQRDYSDRIFDLARNDGETASLIAVDFINALVDRVAFKDNKIEKERIIDGGIEIIYRIFIKD